MKIRLLLFVLLYLPAVVSAAEMRLFVEMLDGGSAYLTIETVEPENFEEIKKILPNPFVQSAIGQRVAALFCQEVYDFAVSAVARSIYVDVECTIANRRGNVWEIEGKNLSGETAPFYLEIELPKGYSLVAADPEPDVSSGQVLRWERVDFIPHVVYKKSILPLRVFLASLAVLILVALFYGSKKR
jgi:hypothetical protein